MEVSDDYCHSKDERSEGAQRYEGVPRPPARPVLIALLAGRTERIVTASGRTNVATSEGHGTTEPSHSLDKNRGMAPRTKLQTTQQTFPHMRIAPSASKNGTILIK